MYKSVIHYSNELLLLHDIDIHAKVYLAHIPCIDIYLFDTSIIYIKCIVQLIIVAVWSKEYLRYLLLAVHCSDISPCVLMCLNQLPEIKIEYIVGISHDNILLSTLSQIALKAFDCLNTALIHLNLLLCIRRNYIDTTIFSCKIKLLT